MARDDDLIIGWQRPLPRPMRHFEYAMCMLIKPLALPPTILVTDFADESGFLRDIPGRVKGPHHSTRKEVTKVVELFGASTQSKEFVVGHIMFDDAHILPQSIVILQKFAYAIIDRSSTGVTFKNDLNLDSSTTCFQKSHSQAFISKVIGHQNDFTT